MRMLALLLLSTTLGAGAASAAPLLDVSWLSGDWRRCQAGEIVEERWLGPRGETMIGANLTSSPGKTSFLHFRIPRSDDI